MIKQLSYSQNKSLEIEDATFYQQSYYHQRSKELLGGRRNFKNPRQKLPYAEEIDEF